MTKKLKIGHITYVYKPSGGGQENYIKNLIKVFDNIGAKSTVYQPINKHYHYFSKNKDKRVKLVFNLPFISRFSKFSGIYLFNIFLITRFISLLKEDIIIVHYAFHALPLWFFKKKIIILSHGVEWYLENQNINDRIHHYIAKSTFKYFTIVANDTHYFRTLGLDILPSQNYFSEISDNKWFIPNCTDINIFKNVEPLPELIGKNIILVPRQITEDRGIYLSIEAFKEFSDEYSGYILLIVGPVRNILYKQHCDRLIAEAGLTNKVIWRHNVTNEDMPKYYSSAKITLIPTLRREGTSLSALESMSCECPVVATDIAGLKDLPVVHAQPTPNDVKNKIIYVLHNWDKIKDQQKVAVTDIFNIQNWQDAWLNVIDKLKNQIN